MIFPVLDLDEIVQVDDKTRLDATLSYISKDEAAITLVEIEPSAGAGFVDVSSAGSLPFSDWYLDYQYTGASATITVSCRITTDGVPTTTTKTISLLTEVDDHLFSNDNDLKERETQIMKWLPEGRSSYKYAHRAAQKKIIAHLDEIGLVDEDGDPYTKTSVVRMEEVELWSRSLTLGLIYNDISDKLDDDFKSKSNGYISEAQDHKNRAVLRLDTDGDGIQEEGEGATIQTFRITR